MGSIRAGRTPFRPYTAAALVSRGIKAQMIGATELIVTDNHFGSAVPLFQETRQM